MDQSEQDYHLSVLSQFPPHSNPPSSQVVALKSLHSKLQDISVYLTQVSDGKLPVNHPIIYQLQDVFNLLPNLNVPDLMKAFTVKTNDQNLVIWIKTI